MTNETNETNVVQQMTTQNDLIISEEIKSLLTKAAEDQGAAEVSSIPYMSIKGKKFSVGDEKLGTTLDVVILADIFDHAWYDKDYDPDVINPPACWAIGIRENEMEPPDSVPVKQSETCITCPQNEFGSAKNGKGKACRNGRRLLVASVTSNGVNLSDLAIINIPPTSLKAYARYTKNITAIHKLPTWAVVTRLAFDEDSAWPSIIPNYMAIADANTIGKVAGMLNEYQTLISQPYDTSDYVPLDIVAATEKKKSKMS
jgi:hypothetical protein